MTNCVCMYRLCTKEVCSFCLSTSDFEKKKKKLRAVKTLATHKTLPHGLKCTLVKTYSHETSSIYSSIPLICYMLHGIDFMSLSDTVWVFICLSCSTLILHLAYEKTCRERKLEVSADPHLTNHHLVIIIMRPFHKFHERKE